MPGRWPQVNLTPATAGAGRKIVFLVFLPPDKIWEHSP
jgi:hypothetical protein